MIMDEREQLYRKKLQKKRSRDRIKRKRRRIQHFICGCVILSVTIVFVAVLLKSFNFDNEDIKEDQADKEETLSVTKEDEKSSAVITLEENITDTLLLGEAFVEPGYKAADKDGIDLTGQVEVDTTGVNHAGIQQIVYTVKDSKGRETKTVREIEILPNTQYDTTGLPICMFHYIYDKNNPPEDLNSNFISTDVLEEELKYLKENNYYFPTWQEVRDYIDGRMLLPSNSIVLCFDDNPLLIELGFPIFKKYEVPVTCFVITGYWESKETLMQYKSEYVNFETHSHYMHEAGGTVGHGGIYTAMSNEEIISDLRQSIEMCGNGNAFAYPFGDYTEDRISALQEVGLLCAVTTEYGKSYPGYNPYTLPRIRMSDGQTLEEFIAKIQ